MTAVGIYARISLDRDGDAAGVERQVADAEALVGARGWSVAGTFVDNDRSAYNGKARPEWRHLLEALAAGTIDSVVAWSSDRLYRRTRDQLELMEAVRVAGGVIATVKDGDVDPASAEGRMRMGILANVAEFESARKAERVARAAEQRAASGRPHGRPSFGWKHDAGGEWVIDHDAAMLIREASKRVLIGESVGSIVRDWNEQGLPTSTRVERWSPQTLRKLLRRPANAGLRVHRGTVAGPATWPALVDVETHEAVVGALRGNGQRRPRRYLLTGLIVCGKDGERMSGHRARVNDQVKDGYVCRLCYRRIVSDRLDALVTEAVLTKLSTPRLVERLARARNDQAEADALRDLDRADARLTELSALFGSGELELAEYRAARDAARARRGDAERRLASRRGSRVLADALTVATDIRGVWDQQGIAWRRELIRAVVERIEIGASTRATWEPERVKISWRT